jgi:GlpG protein
MRSLTTIDGKPDAEAFVAYLLTLGISTHVEAAGDSWSKTPTANSAANSTGQAPDVWEVWIKNEDRLPQAKEELATFLANPKDPKYAAALKQANHILRDQRQEAKLRQRNIQSPNLGNQRTSMFSGKLPALTLTLLILCCVFGLVTAFSSPAEENRLGLSIVKQLKFVDMGLLAKTNDPTASLRRGELWRIFTPAFLHGSPLHLLMNMLALASLGRLVEHLIGIRRYAMLLLLIAAGSHLPQGLLGENILGIQGLSGSPNFVGISGVIMGLFGYIAVKSKMRPDLGFSLSGQSYFMVGILLVMGFAGEIFGKEGSIHMANFAHLGGLVTGAVLGFLSEARRS